MKRLEPAAWRVLALMAACTLAGCSSAPRGYTPPPDDPVKWDALVDQHIPDAARAARLKTQGGKLFELQRALALDAQALDEQGAALNTNYQATRDEARQLLGAFEAKRKAAFSQYRDLVFALRAELSPSEWKALMK